MSFYPKYTPQLARKLYRRYIMLGKALENNCVGNYKLRAQISEGLPDEMALAFKVPQLDFVRNIDNRFTQRVTLRKQTANLIISQVKLFFQITQSSHKEKYKKDIYDNITNDQLITLGINTLFFLERACGIRPLFIYHTPPNSQGQIKEIILSHNNSSMDAFPGPVKDAITQLSENPFLSPVDFPSPVKEWLSPERLIVDHSATQERLMLQRIVKQLYKRVSKTKAPFYQETFLGHMMPNIVQNLGILLHWV